MPAYRILVVPERQLPPRLRRQLVRLLSGTLDEGPCYREAAWRTLPPLFRAIALTAGERVAGQASGFRVRTEPEVGLFGLGDVAVDPAHRRRGLARSLCGVVTSEASRRGAGVVLAKTKPLRSVLADLGYRPVERFDYYYELGGACARHPDWMAVVWRAHPSPVRLSEGDF